MSGNLCGLVCGHALVGSRLASFVGWSALTCCSSCMITNVVELVGAGFRSYGAAGIRQIRALITSDYHCVRRG
jgi:hypothetical protein